MKKTRYTKDELYNLLPAVYRQRDTELAGKALESLIAVIAEQAQYLEEDIGKLYNNWFIETCDEWVVPYISDLVGAKLLNTLTGTAFSQRAWVANTLSYRRRKGTLSMLEQLARDVTGWDTRAVEFFEYLCTTQYLNHLRMSNHCTLDLRNLESLDLLNTPFDKTAHTVDVRNISTKRGFYNIPNIGLFLWRLQAFPVVMSPAFSHGDGKFSFNQLGYDMPLFNYHKTESGDEHLSEEINISGPIRRRVLYDDRISDYYYARVDIDAKSIMIERDDLGSVDIDKIIVCDLTGWQHRPPLDSEKVAIDPVLGRIIFPIGIIPKSVHVSYYYGFSSEVGGGFYSRSGYHEETENDTESRSDLEKDVRYYISKKGPIKTINEAIKQWDLTPGGKQSKIFEITDSEIYEEDLTPLSLPAEITLEIRASKNQRPLLRLKSPLKITGETYSSLILDGLLINTSGMTDITNYNNTLIIVETGNLGQLIINHCTLVPGRNNKDVVGGEIAGELTDVEEEIDDQLLFNWDTLITNEREKTRLKSFLKNNFEISWLDLKPSFKKANEKTIVIDSEDGKHSISIILDDNKIKAALRIDGAPADEVNAYEFIVRESKKEDGTMILEVYNCKTSLLLNGGNNELQISLVRSISGRIKFVKSEARLKVIDSIVDGKGPLDALTCYKAQLENSTIFGKTSFIILEIASNSIFTDMVFAIRRQIGCVRFCYIPIGSQTPRRYRCQPEYSPGIPESIRDAISLRVHPLFTSTRYGDPGYAQLHKNISEKIFEGADNRSEMGVFNHLYQPQRINNLKSVIVEYLRFGLEAGIFLVT